MSFGYTPPSGGDQLPTVTRGNILVSDANGAVIGANQATSFGSGTGNTTYGTTAGDSLTTGSNNTFLGNDTGTASSTGAGNTGVGKSAMSAGSLSGANNTAVGFQSGRSLTSGYGNTVLGKDAGYALLNGCQNTFIGMGTGYNETSGFNNVGVGYSVGPSTYGLSNTICIGSSVYASASNTAKIGNASMTSIGGQVAWSTLSDIRKKKNIEDLTLGVDFVNKLRPVFYQKIDNEKGQTEFGVIAQELKETFESYGFDNISAVQDDGSEDKILSVSYDELTPFLIKSVQELSKRVEELENRTIWSQIKSYLGF